MVRPDLVVEAPTPPREAPLSGGERAIRFIEKLKHTGDYSGKPIRLRPWQRDLVAPLFEGDYDRAFWGLPRKHGKSELVGALIVFLLYGQGIRKRDQQIFSASGDRAQAGIVFKAASQMIRQDAYLSRLCKIYNGNPKRIVVPSLNNEFTALSSDAPTKHGLNPSCVIFDEVHVFPNRELHDTLTSAMGSRLNPLTIYITTAGNNRFSLCYELWKHAEAVIQNPELDPTLHAVIFQASPDDDWTNEDVWKKAMPAYGDFVQQKFIQREFEQAKIFPSYESTFKQLYLNLWVEDLEKVWIPSALWAKCRREIDWDSFDGEPCYAGLDLSRVNDISALCLYFPLSKVCLPFFWLPSEYARQREEADRVPYSVWARDTSLNFRVSNSKTVDYGEIEKEIIELAERFDIQALAYDPWNARELATSLENAGLNMLEYGQSFSYMNAPCRKLESLILKEEIGHDGNPPLAWQMSNIILESKNEIIRPSKTKSRQKIDGGVALLMALGVSMKPDETTQYNITII